MLDNGVEVPQPGLRTARVGDEETRRGKGSRPCPGPPTPTGCGADLGVFDFDLDTGAMSGIARLNTGRRVGDQDPATHEERPTRNTDAEEY